MKKTIKYTLALLVFCAASVSLGRLEFDTTANKVQLYGPFVKYNILKPPYSFSRFKFELNDIDLEIVHSSAETAAEDPSDKPTESAETREPQSSGEMKLFVKWPRFLLSFGRLRFIGKNNRVLLNMKFSESMVGTDDKFARLHLEGEGESLLSALGESFQICVDQKFEASYVKACSDFLEVKDGKVARSFTGKNQGSAQLNNRKVPNNSQISLDQSMKKVNLALKFKSGFALYINDKIRNLKLENLAIDPLEKRIGIVSGDGSIRPTRLTIKDRFFDFIEEKNYFKNKYAATNQWPQNLEDAEMEFAPYETGASSQLYGLILPKVPPPFKFKLNDDIAIATYSSEVELKGTKDPAEVLAAKVTNELFIHENGQDFIWNFPAPKTGEVNQNYLSLQHKGKDHYFSKRIFAAHQSAVSGALALSTSTTLDVVLGYNFWAEHWFEQLWNKSKYSYQRWGFQANAYSTAQGFKPSKDFPGKIGVNPINFDILYRLTPGVRPVQSSFGLGLRYLNFSLLRSIGDDIETNLLGIGGFWHSAPQKIVDDIFNIVPFFRYPKWMEISCYYYPLLIGPEKIGFSFSWQARGRMFFSKRWFIDASFNVNAVSFQREALSGVTLGANEFGIGTAHGTIGIGAFFN